MSSLQRYKKSGGFVQLLSLIETFGPQKREKFLEMIEAESPVWANALREKMLSLERIFGWDDQIVLDIFKRLPAKSQAFALTGLKDEYKAKLSPYFSPSELRRMNDVLTESKPKPDEIQATHLKIVEMARKMLSERELSAEKFDVALIVPEDFEAKLSEKEASSYAETINDPAASQVVMGGEAPAPAAAAGAPASAEVYQLQRSLAVLMKENKALKEEVRTLRDKLEQIRKIA